MSKMNFKQITNLLAEISTKDLVKEIIDNEFDFIHLSDSLLLKIVKCDYEFDIELKWFNTYLTNIQFTLSDTVENKDDLNKYIQTTIINRIKDNYFNNWFTANIGPIINENLESSIERVNNRLLDFNMVVNLIADSNGSFTLSCLDSKNEKFVYHLSLSNNTDHNTISNIRIHIYSLAYSVFYHLFFKHNGFNSSYGTEE